MVNMNVGFVRSCRSLLTLQDNIEVWRPGREQNLGFITGYKALARTGMLSGHYPDHNGITFAYDIGVDIQGDGSGLKPSDAEWLANYLCEEMHPRFQYLIYNGRIRGNHTGWEWAPYYGPSPHKNHIHISVVDVAYGEPSGVSPSVFDSTASWGLSGAVVPAGDVQTAKPTAPKVKGKQYVTLPAGVPSWAVYRLGVAPVAGNQFNGINTARYGKLVYEVKDWAQKHVAIIETAQLGRVQIYVAPSTGAKITGKKPGKPKRPEPKPKPKPAVSRTGLYAYLGNDATSWNIYRPGVAPVAGNEYMKLNPRKHSYHRKYPFLEWVTPGKVALISTVDGPMQIYIGADTPGYVGP